MKKIDEKGFSHVLLVVLFLLSICAAGFAFWRVSSSRTTNNESLDNKNTSVAAVKEDPVTELIDGARELNPDTLNNAGLWVVVDAYLYEPENDPNSIMSVSIDDDVFVNFEKDSRYLKEDFQKLMANNGMSLESSHSDSEGTEFYGEYQSDLLLCSVSATTFFGRINCITRDSLDKRLKELPDLVASLVATKGNVTNIHIGSFLNSTDGLVTGAIVSYGMYTDNQEYGLYFVRMNGKWTFLAQDTRHVSYLKQPSCSIVAKAEYKGVFADYCEE